MIDVYSFKKYTDKSKCPVCQYELRKIGFNKGIEYYSCLDNCLVPLNIQFLFGKGKMFTVKAARDNYEFLFRLNNPNVDIIINKQYWITQNINCFNLESLTRDSWMDTIKTLVIFS